MRARVTVPLVVALLACGRGREERSAAGADTERAAPRSVVDSVMLMEVALERFRAGLSEPTALTRETGSRDGLVLEIVRALAAADTTRFEALAVHMAEWAWLYYPTSTTAQPPYELPPGLAWFQLQEENRTGVLRALRELGGHRLDYRGYTCADDPKVEGTNRVWIRCMVTLGVDGAPPTPLRLFSAILERDGRFAILSYANDF